MTPPERLPQIYLARLHKFNPQLLCAITIIKNVLYTRNADRVCGYCAQLQPRDKTSKASPVLTLLTALGLLYVGIDRMFFDRIAGSDSLARIERILAILVGTLLVALSISLFVAAWTGRPLAAMNTDSVKGKLLAHAFCPAPGALVFGFCLVRAIKRFDNIYLTVMLLFGAVLIADLLWTRREVRRLAASETAKKAATQFLWSCVFFNMLAFGLGIAASGWNWFSTDFMQGFNLLFWSAMTGIAIYPVCRDVKRLADAAGPSQIPSR
jgi:hypothetical protein